MSQNLFKGIDLGLLPIANELNLNVEESHEIFPLNMKICADCGLGQVENLVSPKRLFEDYRYLSSVSSSFLQHAKSYAQELKLKYSLSEKSLVIEIASNDGYFLRNFLDMGVPVLGIEPAKNVAEIGEKLGIKTINSFFGAEIANSVLEEFGIPTIIVANNVAAHVPDLSDFFSGIATLCGPETVVSIENPSILNILYGRQFDSIYHEHFSYLSAHSMKIAAARCGLVLVEVKVIPTHGGSLRYVLKKDSDAARALAIRNGVEIQCNNEKEKGLIDPNSWISCQSNVRILLNEFNTWLHSAMDEGRKVIGFGAAAKSSTLINAANIPVGSIQAIIDSSPEKSGRFMPIRNIPIVSISDAIKLQPTDIIIFPWNLKEEISDVISLNFNYQPRVWTVIPSIMEVHR